MREELSEKERKRFSELTEIVKSNIDGFWKTGAALREIKESKLYRDEYDTWEDFCQQRFQIGRAHATRLIEAEKIKMSPIGDKITTESQAREIAKVPEMDRAAVLKNAEVEAEKARKPLVINKKMSPIGDILTAKSIGEAADKLKEAKASVIPKDAPKPPAVLDVDGIAVPPIAMQFWNRQPEVRKILSAISEIEAVLSKAQTDGDMMFSEVIISGAICDLRNAKSNIAGALPQHVCNCQGLRSEKCTLCKGKGILSNFYYKTHVPKDVREFRARCKK